jgi:hypothetical protein
MFAHFFSWMIGATVVLFGIVSAARAQTVMIGVDGTVLVHENNRTLWSLAPETSVANRGAPAVRSLLSGGQPIVAVDLPVVGKDQKETWIGRRVGARVNTLWHGITGSLYADGELARIADIASTGITIWQRSASITRCDGPARLFEQRLDLLTGAFFPVPPTNLENAVALTASVQGPHAEDAHPGSGFRFTAASDRDGANGDVLRLGVPTMLHDRNPATAWVGSRGTTSVFFTARGPAAAGITGLRLFASPDAAHGGPTRIEIALGGKVLQRFFAVLPPLSIGRSIWVPLPAAVDAGCVTVVARGFDPARNPALGEVEIFTRADGAEGGAHVLAQLKQGQDCDDNLRIAATTLGDKLASTLLATLANAQLAGQRCLVKGLSADAALPMGSVPPQAVAALVSVLKTLDPERDESMERDTLSVLERVGEPALPALEVWFDSVAHDERQVGRAARALASIRSLESVSRLLEKLASESVRLPVRVAISESKWPVVDSVLAAISRVELVPPTETLMADRLWILARRVRREPESRVAIAHAATLGLAASPFVVRARAIEVLSMLGDAASASRLIEVLRKDSDPVLQMLAGQGLSMPGFLALKDGSVAGAMFDALRATDPRVREVAARWLGRHGPGNSGAQLLSAFQSERWPFVRVGLVAAMGQRCPAKASQTLAVSTRSDSADERRAALVAMSSCQPVDARPLFFATLESNAEVSSVRSVAARLIGEIGSAADAVRLDGVLGTLAASGRPELDSVVGEALASLVRLDRNRALPRALSLVAEKRIGLKRVSIESLGALCDPGAGALALKSAAAGADGWLASSARTAISRCEGTRKLSPIDQP